MSAEHSHGLPALTPVLQSDAGMPKIKYTFVRGASDYLYAPPLEVSPGVWEDNPAVPPTNFDTQVHTASCCIPSVVRHGIVGSNGSLHAQLPFAYFNIPKMSRLTGW
jgi:hypothetical protein